MNAHSQAFADDTPIAARRALSDAIAIYDNNDSLMQEGAIDAIAAGRAAFWTTSQYHNGIGSMLPHPLNRGEGAEAAIDYCCRGTVYGIVPHKRDEMQVEALEWIVPLNLAAARELSHAYAKHGFWKDEAELLTRAKSDMRQRPGKPVKAALPQHTTMPKRL